MKSPASIDSLFNKDEFSVKNMENNCNSPSSSFEQDHQKQSCSQFHETLIQSTKDTISSSPTDAINNVGVISREISQSINASFSTPSSNDHCLNQETINCRSSPEIQTLVTSLITNRSLLGNEGRQGCMGDPKMDSVVKVFCAHSHPDYLVPWQRTRQFTSISSGFVIRRKRILTTAHSVDDYVHVKLRKRNSHVIYEATVLAIGIECDLALLTVDDDEFWKGVVPVDFEVLPKLQDAVTVVGYSMGGDTVSVTRAVVSQIKNFPYGYGACKLLGLQIDTPILQGHSGGPAFNDKGKCVGVAFQDYKKSDGMEEESCGFVVPTPIIMHFIQDYNKHGRYTGFPVLGVEWQMMDNPDMRFSFGMKPNQTGVRVTRIDPTTSAHKFMKPSDVILRYDGVKIANDGTRDVAKIEVLRNSEILKFDVKLGTLRRLIPAHNKGRPPSFYIIAGFVFTTLSLPYLSAEYGLNYESEAPAKLLNKLSYEQPKFLDEQIVLLSQVLLSDISIGYEDIVNAQVLAFNGQTVRNLKDLANMVERCTDEYMKFDLEYDQIIVLRTEESKAETSRILSANHIPASMSNDLKESLI